MTITLRLVLTATMCFDTASMLQVLPTSDVGIHKLSNKNNKSNHELYPRAAVIQLLTVLAFSIVSAVVKVFDTITTETSKKKY